MEEISGFVCVNKVQVMHVEVLEYVSRRSGLRVFFMRYESPVVNSYYILPTRGENHEGLPHTLEHLIFLGSEKYQHRGTLDILASRALSIGTNAWTAVDHTAYTISTAGLEGTLKILPVYLDHILRPTLTDLSFMTDVHRVTPDGTNSGTVYCEMKTHENTADNLSHFEMVEHLYPGPSGYKMNTGGRLDALRETNIERVRDYHLRFYRLENLSIALCGSIDNCEAVLELIRKAEEDLIANGVQARPVDVPSFFGAKQWEDPVNCQKLEKSSSHQVVFPSDDEESGMFTMAWRGPAWNDYEVLGAVTMMGVYLTETALSPLQKALVHTEDPFGSSVEFSLENYRESYFSITVQDVPCGPNGKMEQMETKLRNLLNKIHQSPIDMDRMRTIVQRERLTYFLSLENSPHEAAIDGVITYINYSNDRSDLAAILLNDSVSHLLLQKNEQYWSWILSRYFIEPPTVSVVALPSIKRSTEIERFEAELIETQLRENDIEMLKEREKLVDAIISNKKGGVPKEVVDAFEMASVSKLKLTEWPYVRNYSSVGTTLDGGRQVFGRTQIFNEHGGSIPVASWLGVTQSLDNLAFPMQINHIASNFVRLSLMVPTRRLNLSHLENQALSLLCALLFVSGVRSNDGTELSGDEFITQLQQWTTAYGANLGLDSALGDPDSYAELLHISVTCHVESYNKMFQLLRHLLSDVRFNKKILTAHTKALLKSLKKKKRMAKALIIQASNAMRLHKTSVRISCGLAQQLKFLKSVLDGNMLEPLQSLYHKLFTPGNLVVHVSCDLNKMPEGWVDQWSLFSGGNPVTSPLTEHIGFKFGIDTVYSDLNGLFATLASTDVGYFRFVIPAPLGFCHEEYSALCVLSEYLSMMEGPMFRAIRGGGFAYNYSVSYYPSRGELHLSIQQATDLVGAIRATQELFRKIIDGQVLNEEDIFAARCSMVFNILEEEESLADYSNDTFTSALRGVGAGFTRDCLAKIQTIGTQEVRRVSIKYLREFLSFGAQGKTMAIISSRSQGKEIFESLGSLNYNGIAQTNIKGILEFSNTGEISECE